VTVVNRCDFFTSYGENSDACVDLYVVYTTMMTYDVSQDAPLRACRHEARDKSLRDEPLW